MTDEALSTELSYATVVQNLADNPTPVTTWDVPEGTAIRLAQGHPAILDVDAAGGGNLSRATSLGLAYREPLQPHKGASETGEPVLQLPDAGNTSTPQGCV